MRVAVFDLDGTLTRRDTLWPYLRGWARLHPHAGFWPRVLAAVGRYPFAFDRGDLKERLIRIAMGGADGSAVRGYTDGYVAALGDRELCPGALAAIERHRATGADQTARNRETWDPALRAGSSFDVQRFRRRHRY